MRNNTVKQEGISVTLLLALRLISSMLSGPTFMCS